MLAMPALWGGSLTVLFAIAAMERARLEEWLLATLERCDPFRRTAFAWRSRAAGTGG
jgi:hypothetical protein